MQRALNRLTLSLRSFARDTSGAQLVEFALVLPMMLLVFAVIIEGGRMMWSYQTVVAGVRDASRFLARVTDRNICDTPGAVFNFDSTLLTFVRTSNDGTSIFPSGVTVTGVTSSLQCFTGTYRSDEAPIVTVEAAVTITFPFAGLFTLVGGSQPTLTSSVADQSRVYGS
ncbi:TadE/TadG family type IV pilus assembly protein [Tabrizicola sp. BL-A-41-H6]|uniref:TadE/TadG family type IV pilus assembly protein n=1 Tax=Tabrizicola sp. BL-A-41-H6 TaxID=3421107 RepID=UPI003D67955F